MKYLWILLATAVLCVFSTYTYFLHSNSISQNPQNWGVFGDYIGGVLNPVFAIANLYMFFKLTKEVEKGNERNNEKQLEFEAKKIKVDIIFHLRVDSIRELRNSIKSLNTNLSEGNHSIIESECISMMDQISSIDDSVFVTEVDVKPIVNSLKNLVDDIKKHQFQTTDLDKLRGKHLNSISSQVDQIAKDLEKNIDEILSNKKKS